MEEFQPVQRAMKSAAKTEGVVRVGPLMNLPHLMRKLGCDPEPLFAETGISADQFNNPDTEVPYRSAALLIHRCATVARCPHFGLLLGEDVIPSALGMAGFALLSAPNVRDALLGLQRDLDLHERGGSVSLEIAEATTYLGYAIQLSSVEGSDIVYDLAMTIACRIMRALCGAQWNPAAVHLAHGQPSDLRPYRRFFRAPLHFNEDRSALAFTSRWLDYPVATADPHLHQYLEKTAKQLHENAPRDFIELLHRQLHSALTHNTCTAASVAQGFGIHERTLNRRLLDAGTTFQRELDKVRLETARQLLERTEASLPHIADLLGYSDGTAFIRAFKRWTGVTPARWRREKPPS